MTFSYIHKHFQLGRPERFPHQNLRHEQFLCLITARYLATTRNHVNHVHSSITHFLRSIFILHPSSSLSHQRSTSPESYSSMPSLKILTKEPWSLHYLTVAKIYLVACSSAASSTSFLTHASGCVSSTETDGRPSGTRRGRL